jgi:hypothetical protein
MPAEAPACLPVDCGDVVPDHVEYGTAIEYRWDPLQTVGPTRYLARAVYKCRTGFTLLSGAAEFERSCTALRQWAPAAPTCVDIDECDPSAHAGKHFVNCTELLGVQSRCINTFGGHVCTPFIDVSHTAPMTIANAAGTSSYDPVTHEIHPSGTFGGQVVRFAVRGGVGLAAPFVSQVRYSNPNETLYADASLLDYPCSNVSVTWPSDTQTQAAGFQHFFVECTLSPGQGADLYFRLQYCFQTNASTGDASTVNCDNWNWEWSGKLSDAPQLARIGDNSFVRVTYPMHSFVPASIHAITAAGVTQRGVSYVASSTAGDDIGFDILNLYLERPELVSITYGRATTPTDYPYKCEYNKVLTHDYGGRYVIICHTDNGLTEVDLKFRLRIAGRTAYTDDTYSYPQLPIVESVRGCSINNHTSGATSGCPTDSGDVRLTIAGSGFLEPLTVMIAGRQCSNIIRANNTHLTCKLPLGTGVGLSVIVKSGSQRTEERDRISYATPALTSIVGCERVSATSIRQCDRRGGDRIQLTGTNLGVSGATVSIGGVACTNLVHDARTPHQRLTCIIPEGSTQDRPVTVLQRYGEISREMILLSYVQCAPGTFNDGVQCQPCSPGSYNDLWSQSLCRPCLPGTFANITGATKCTDCPLGTYSGISALTCSMCSRGTFAQTRAEACTQCAPGTFASQEGSAQCDTCPLGAEQTSDYSYCHCKAGSYQTLAGTCAACMLGGDCTQPGTTVFNIKSLPSYTPAISTRSRESVVRLTIRLALPAVTADQQRAVRALLTKAIFDGTLHPRSRIEIARVASGSDAARNTSTSVWSALDGLDPSDVSDVAIDVAPVDDAAAPTAADVAALIAEHLSTVLAPGSSVQIGTSYITAPVRDVSFSQYATQSFLPCINNACLGGSSCIEGHSGPLCTVCLPGYGKTGAFVCKKCNPPALRIAILVIAVIGAIALCAILVWKQIIDGRKSMNELPAPAVPLLFKIATSGVQVMAIAARYDLRWPGFLEGFFEGADTAGGVGTAFLSLDCFLDQDPLIRPFWVTSIGIMVLPLLGVLLPLLVFVPRYIATKRVYRARVLAEVAQQRAMLVEMLDELKAFEKGKRYVDRLDRLEREQNDLLLGNALKPMWDMVNERHEDGIAAAAPDAVERNEMAARYRGIDLDNKDTPAAGRSSKPRRKRIVRHPGKAPLAPPVAPPTSSGTGFMLGSVLEAEPGRAAPERVLYQPELSVSRTGALASMSGVRPARLPAPPVSVFAPIAEDSPWVGDDDSETEELSRGAIASGIQRSPTRVHFATDGVDDILDSSDEDAHESPALQSPSGLTVDVEASAYDRAPPPEPSPTSHVVDETAETGGDAAVLSSPVLKTLLEDVDGVSDDDSEHKASDKPQRPDFHFFGDDFDLGALEFNGAALGDNSPDKVGLPGLIKFKPEVDALAARVKNPDGSLNDEAIRAAAAARIADAKTTEELASIVQSAEDLDCFRLLISETFQVMYDAETLRERLVYRERSRDRARQQRQLAWYIEQYGGESGKKLFKENLQKTQQSRTLRLTAGELRLRVDSAEMTYNQIVTEFMGYWITAITVVMFMIHPNITRQFFMVLTCKTVGDLDDPGASFLLGDMTEPCYSAQHVLFIFALGIPMALLWVLGIPLFAFIVLYRNSHLIQLPAVGVSTIMRVKKRNFEAQMAFLYRGYRPSRYYWFLVEMLKKVILVGISVFFPGALHTQLLMASLLVFVCILAQIASKPFENKVPEFAEFFSLFSSFMIFFLANFLFVDTVSESSKVVVTVIICVAALAFVCVVAASFVILTKEEFSLAPLRKRLALAHASGADTAEVLREWRRDQIALAKSDTDNAATAGPENEAGTEGGNHLLTLGKDHRTVFSKTFGEIERPQDRQSAARSGLALDDDSHAGRLVGAANKINAGEDLAARPVDVAGAEGSNAVFKQAVDIVKRRAGTDAALEDDLVAKICL